MLWLSLSIANTARTDLRLRGRGGVHTAGSGERDAAAIVGGRAGGPEGA